MTSRLYNFNLVGLHNICLLYIIKPKFFFFTFSFVWVCVFIKIEFLRTTLDVDRSVWLLNKTNLRFLITTINKKIINYFIYYFRRILLINELYIMMIFKIFFFLLSFSSLKTDNRLVCFEIFFKFFVNKIVHFN